MSTERVVRLDDFRKSPIDSSRRHDPLFMMLYRPAELREWCKDASIEAKALALELLVETFCRGKAFASEEEEAAAVRIDGIHHMQTRRVRRIKEQSPGGFTLIEGLIEAACGKYPEGKRPAKSGKRGRKRGHNHLGNRVGNQGENQGEKRGVFSSKTPANPPNRGAQKKEGKDSLAEARESPYQQKASDDAAAEPARRKGKGSKQGRKAEAKIDRAGHAGARSGTVPEGTPTHLEGCEGPGSRPDRARGGAVRGRVADSAALRGGVAVGRDAEDVDEAQVFRDRLTVQHPSHWWLQGKGDAVFCAGCECVVRAGAPVPASLYQQPCNPYRKRNYPNYDEQQREDQAAAVRRLGPEIAARLAQEAAIRYAEEAAREDLRRKQEQDPQRREEAALRMAALRAQFETPEDEEEAEAVEEEEQDEEEAAAQRLADYWGIKH